MQLARIIKNHGTGMAAAAAAAVLVLTSCSSGSSASDTDSASAGTCVDVGLEECVEVRDPIKMAWFSAGLGSTWGAASVDEAKKYGAAQGIDLTVFDASYDPNKQFQQIQTALSSGQYNAIGVVILDPDLTCKALTETAPAQGIIVAAANQPLCQAGTGDDVSTYAPPGTLTFAGGTNVRLGLAEWLEEAAAKNPGKQTVALVTGTETDGISKKLDSLLPDFKSKHPDWNFVAVNRTDYSSAQGFNAAQDILNAHPDITVMLSVYADITTGAQNAIAQAGKAGELALIDYNGNGETAQMVCDGLVQFTVPEVPRSAAKMAIDSIVAAYEGKDVERFQRAPQPVLSKDDACDYKAEY